MASTLKPLLRDAFVLATAVLLAPVWLPAWVERRVGGEGWFVFGAELVSLAPGRIGVYLRRAYYRMTLDACASDVHVGFLTTFSHRDCDIGPGVYLGNRCTVGKATIGRDATVGSNVDILSGRRQHHFDDPSRPVQAQGGR